MLASIIGSFVLCLKIKSATAILSFISTTTLLVVVFLTTHPILNKIQTPAISIESQLRQVVDKQKELTKITTLLMKIFYISQDMELHMEPLPQYSKRIDEYIAELNEYLPPNFSKEIEKEIQDLLREAEKKQ